MDLRVAIRHSEYCTPISGGGEVLTGVARAGTVSTETVSEYTDDKPSRVYQPVGEPVNSGFADWRKQETGVPKHST
jgi:hypothetical protein